MDFSKLKAEFEKTGLYKLYDWNSDIEARSGMVLMKISFDKTRLPGGSSYIKWNPLWNTDVVAFSHRLSLIAEATDATHISICDTKGSLHDNNYTVCEKPLMFVFGESEDSAW